MKEKLGKVQVTISNKTVIRVIVLALAAFILIKLFFKLDHVIELIFMAFFLSVALNPAVSWISRNLRLKSRLVATSIAYLIVVIILAAFFSLVIPPLVHQTIQFIDKVPSTITSLQDSNSPAGKFVTKYHLENQANSLGQYIQAHTKNLQGPVLTTASKIGSVLVSILTVFVLTFMMIVEGPKWVERYWKLRVISKHEWHREMLEKMYQIITGYVNGQVILAFIGAGFTLVALLIVSSILNVSVNEVALAAIILITGLIPMIGHVIGGAIVVLACLFVSWPLAIIMAIILIVYQQIENITIQPYIQAKYNELTPLLVFVAALIGIGVGGLLGAFVAIPFAGCLKILLKQYLEHQNLIDA